MFMLSTIPSFVFRIFTLYKKAQSIASIIKHSHSFHASKYPRLTSRFCFGGQKANDGGRLENCHPREGSNSLNPALNPSYISRHRTSPNFNLFRIVLIVKISNFRYFCLYHVSSSSLSRYHSLSLIFCDTNKFVRKTPRKTPNYITAFCLNNAIPRASSTPPSITQPPTR